MRVVYTNENDINATTGIISRNGYQQSADYSFYFLTSNSPFKDFQITHMYYST